MRRVTHGDLVEAEGQGNLHQQHPWGTPKCGLVLEPEARTQDCRSILMNPGFLGPEMLETPLVPTPPFLDGTTVPRKLKVHSTSVALPRLELGPPGSRSIKLSPRGREHMQVHFGPH